MKITLVNWPTLGGKVWVVGERTPTSGYTPIKELDTTDINSDLARKELQDAIDNEREKNL